MGGFAVFFHDHRFVVDGEEQILSHGVFPYRIWQRYLIAFASLKVVARRREIDSGLDPRRLSPSNGPNVSFEFVPSVNDPLRYLFGRQRILNRLKPMVAQADAVICRLPSELGLLGTELAQMMGKPCAVELAGCPWDGMRSHGSLTGKFYGPIFTWRVKRAIAAASHVVYVTNGFLQRRYPTAGHWAAISNVDIPPPDAEALSCRLEGPIEDDRRLTFGTIGAISHRGKGIDVALRALAEARSQLPSFVYRVLGPGDPAPYRAVAEQLGLGEQVHFDGTLPGGEPVLRWLDQIDVYLQPSFHEGLPRAVIEAMSRGCTCLGSSVGGIPELLDQECLHTPGDHHQLARQLVHAGAGTDWRSDQARHNFETARRYGGDVLNQRRTAFWLDFGRHAYGAQNAGPPC
ncbi:MAG: glycosyltransferase family 4 protein [Geminicoccaceae bacterium]